MSDLINRQDAIWAMRSLLSESVADTAEIRLNELPSAQAKQVKSVAVNLNLNQEQMEYILAETKKQLSGESTTFEWVSCKDRLPETNGEYLVTVKADSKYAFNNEPTVYTDYFQFGCQWDDCGDDVIAWMPLPEPYKGEKDEN